MGHTGHTGFLDNSAPRNGRVQNCSSFCKLYKDKQRQLLGDLRNIQPETQTQTNVDFMTHSSVAFQYEELGGIVIESEIEVTFVTL